MDTLFSASEFDKWAENYDASVMENSTFPFLGYADVLEGIVRAVKPRKGLKVLDLGAGTGNLSVPLAKAGCEVWCADFSAAMLEKVRLKLPDAHFVTYDMKDPLPSQLNRPFDCIVSAYTFHHFDLDEKLEIIKRFILLLVDDGNFIIGDIAFADETARERVKSDLGDEWEEEFYWQAGDDIPAIQSLGLAVEYHQVTPFSGIFHLKSLVIS
jgi:putative AdoMet-dependent methyltransferase